MESKRRMLGLAVYRGNDTTHKTLETMCDALAWPQKCCKSSANGSSIIALRFGNKQQCATGRVKGGKCNNQQCQELWANNVVSVCTGLKIEFQINVKRIGFKITIYHIKVT